GRGASGGGGRRGDGRGRHAELLLERLDPLGELHHRDPLQLLDPLLRALCHQVSFVSSACSSTASPSAGSSSAGSSSAGASSGSSAGGFCSSICFSATARPEMSDARPR